MAAPSGTTWGSIAGGYGRIGICAVLSCTATVATVTISTWFWSKYSVDDSNNSYYYNNNATSATSKVGSVDINTTVASGSGWSTSNQVKLGQSTYTYNRGTSAVTRNCAIKLTDVDRVGATMTHKASYTIPALPSYKVSYNANGGSGAPSAQTKYYGKSLTLSSTKPTRSGWTFMGWGTSASDTSANYSAGGSYTANAAITLYAVWRKQLALSYNANGGSGAPSSSSAYIYNSTSSKAFTVSSTKPTRTGYSFLGWSTSSGATSATYASGASITISSNTTLYAVWKINSYTLTINPNGGTWNGTADSSKVTQNYKTTKTITAPSWEGHTFSGWSLSGSGTFSNNVYTFGAGAGTLTAKWDTNDYDITFDAGANGGTVNGAEKAVASHEYGTALGELPIAERKNYTFSGWFTEAVGGTQITTAYTVTGDATFYAQFEIDASAYVNASEAWRSGVTFITDSDGKVKKGHAKVNDNGVWKDGFCK